VPHYTFWRLGFRQYGFHHVARIARHATPYAWAWTAGFLACCFPRLPFRGRVSHQIQRHLLPSLPAARAIQQCTSWRTDYYQTSVAIGLASRRRSHVRPCRTCRAERRRPTHLLEYPHWASPVPRRLRRQIRDTDAGHGTGSDVFPVDGGLHRLEIWLRAIQLSPYSAGPATRRPVRLARPLLSWHALVPFTFRIQVSHQTQEPPSEFLPAAPGIQQGAFVAHRICRDPGVMRGSCRRRWWGTTACQRRSR